MENKKNNGLIWLIVVLIILVVALMGFIVCREFFSEEKPSVDNTTNTTTNNLTDDEGDDGYTVNYSVKEQGNLLELLYNKTGVSYEKNYKTAATKLGNISVSINCEDFGESDVSIEPICNKTIVKVGNKVVYEQIADESAFDPYVLVLEDLIIIQNALSMVTSGDTIIYDASGNKILNIENTVAGYFNDENEPEEIDSKIYLENNKVYYVKKLNNNKLSKEYVDLANGFDIIEESEFTANSYQQDQD